MIRHEDGHMPRCNAKCTPEGHWLLAGDFPDTPGPAQPPPYSRRTHPAGQREFATPDSGRPKITGEGQKWP